MLGFVCFMCPGLFNALNGLGGAGQVDETTAANANVALYSCFAGMAFISGSIHNMIGSKMTLLIGTFGYTLYIASYLASNLHPLTKGIDNFSIAAGAILGICAGLLWTAQGSLMLAYPTESQKGRFIGIFWIVFNLGGVIGSAVAFGQANSVSNNTYIAFIVLTFIGTILSLFIANPNKIYRTDGTKVVPLRHPTWQAEITSLGLALWADPMILLLFPLFLASNWFYTWQFNDFNGALFSIRTRALNGMIYWASQMFGSIAIGTLLDWPRLHRRTRAVIGWVVLLVFVMVVHGWAYHYQKDYTRDSLIANPERIDFSTPGYAAYIWLYIFCGLLDSMWQTACYWFMGAMSNDPAKLAYFTGFYKSLQSAGAAGIWRVDAELLPYMNIFASTWALLLGGLFCAAPVLWIRIRDHTEMKDETL
ncbi:MFS general substrate transporter [Dacryopinax primogenitus]|uniref:MFS general substrate transporter n=1 Tax=Dacryopinax primogenitus (strain DJM 731) TaxID=1858805 RepID=M5FSS8_DACPD|nr:MFS general substrate transporter [Dacryopinax primogenitus]EJT99003.1 MFS general substrate transporter [Dacryopinax primogenitus]